MKLHVITSEDLEILKRIATELYRERRLTGDEMRDLAHALTAVVKVSEQIEVPQ